MFVFCISETADDMCHGSRARLTGFSTPRIHCNFRAPPLHRAATIARIYEDCRDGESEENARDPVRLRAVVDVGHAVLTPASCQRFKVEFR